MIFVEQLHYTYKNKNADISIEQSVYRTGSYHYNWHTELELLVVLHGEIEVCSHAVCRVLQEDDVVLINPNSGHATFSRAPGSIAMVLHIDPRFLRCYFDDAERLAFTVCSDAQTRYNEVFVRIRRALAVMAANRQASAPEQRLAMDSAFFVLMNDIITVFPPQRGQNAAFQPDEKKAEAMASSLKYIHKNYRKKLSLDLLAKEMGYNSSYLSQLFKANLGINFYDYLTRIRLREATRQLSLTDARILDIALENGFSDLKSFNTAFHKTFRKTPAEYRSQLSEDHLLSDLAFKKEYLSAEDPLVCEKLSQYQKGAQADENSEALSNEYGALNTRLLALAAYSKELQAQAEQLAADFAALHGDKKLK